MTLTLRQLSPAFAAGAAALAIAAAPSAHAAPTPIDCLSTGPATMCQRQGHAYIHAIPPAASPQQVFGINGIPPLILG